MISNLNIEFFGERSTPNVWITHTGTRGVISKGSCVARSVGLFSTKKPMKNDRKCVKYSIVNIGALTQALLGFCICRKLWVEGISNDPNDLCRTTTHIITIVNIGGSNG